MPTAAATPGSALLAPSDHLLIMVDHLSQMGFATRSIDAIMLRNNTAPVSNAARISGAATILTTVAEKSFSGPIYDEIKREFPGQEIIDRTTMNCWEDENVIRAVNASAKGRVALAGLWTSVCIVGPALSAIEQGFEVYVISDACGDISDEAHERAMQRMVLAGVRPITALQYMLELQRDWARAETYDAVTGTAKIYGGACRLGIICAKAILGAGVLVGIVYSLLNVRSPAPPVIALAGLLGILLGEQIVPFARRVWNGHPDAVTETRADCAEPILGPPT